MSGAKNDPPLLIALTGGIASGKTAVAELFANSACQYSTPTRSHATS